MGFTARVVMRNLVGGDASQRGDLLIDAFHLMALAGSAGFGIASGNRDETAADFVSAAKRMLRAKRRAG